MSAPCRTVPGQTGPCRPDTGTSLLFGKPTGGKPKGKGKGQSPRQRVKQLTQQIVMFAKRKKLADAKQVFKKFKEEGLTPTLLTFSTFT